MNILLTAKLHSELRINHKTQICRKCWKGWRQVNRIAWFGSPQKEQGLAPAAERCWQARTEGEGKETIPRGSLPGAAARAVAGMELAWSGQGAAAESEGGDHGEGSPSSTHCATLHLQELPARIFSGQFPVITGTRGAEKQIISNSIYEKYLADSSPFYHLLHKYRWNLCQLKCTILL